MGKAERKAEKERLMKEYTGRWVVGSAPNKHTLEALLPGEDIIYGFPYVSGAGHSILFPTNIVATTHRFLCVKPEKMGFGSTVTEWQWRDLKNVRLESGFVYGSINVEARYGDGLAISTIGKKEGKQFVKVCQEQIRHALDGTSSTVSAVGGASKVQMTGTQQQQSVQADPLTALKLRLASGEITVEQFKELSELLI